MTGIPDEARRLTTPLWADACVRLGIPLRSLAGLRPVGPPGPVLGRVMPARHAGSVDVFLEAIDMAAAGDVLVIDNGGRLDEGCIGDLTALECQGAGFAGMVVWGAHRDTADLRAIAFPVFSLGSCPNGPLAVRPRAKDALSSAQIGTFAVCADDWVCVDEDGAVFLPGARMGELAAKGLAIFKTERRQAVLAKEGTTIRSQLAFKEYLAARSKEPGLGFREHIRRRGGAIEE